MMRSVGYKGDYVRVNDVSIICVRMCVCVCVCFGGGGDNKSNPLVARVVYNSR